MTWKKRCVSLIVCFALIVSITVVRPPKAEAIAFEAGIAVPIILAVAIASGITFLSDGMTESGLTEYIGQQLQSYATDIGTTVSEWWDGIGSISKRDNGQVVISNPTYQAIQNFISWWKTDSNISSVPSSVYSLPDYFLLSDNLTQIEVSTWSGELSPLVHTGATFNVTLNSPSWSYTFASGSTLVWDSSYVRLSNPQGVQVAGGETRESHGNAYVTIARNLVDGHYYLLRYTDKSGGWNWMQTNSLDTAFYFNPGASVSASQPASYSALDLQDNESVALDLGTTVEAGATLEDILAEYLAKIVDNTATAAQEVTTDSGEGEGEGDDDDTAPYLPFIPRIWEKLQGLPDDIADKVHDLFVPSAAFVEALPAEFADVFDSRCGLLTYPAALLADFLTRLATLTAQEPVLRWGNINEPFSDRQLIAAGSYNLNSAIQTDAMQTVYNVYMIVVKAAVAFWFVELCKRKYEKIIRS